MSIDEVEKKKSKVMLLFPLLSLSLSLIRWPFMVNAFLSRLFRSQHSEQRESLSLSLLRKELLSKTVWWPTTFLGPSRIHRHSPP